MALLERVSTLLRANLNDLIDKAEDPQKLLRQLVLDMENQLMQVKTQVAIADSRRAFARRIAVSRSASAAATSASRLIRATSGRPMLVM